MSKFEASFALKEPNSESESLLYMKVYHNYKRITVSTGIKVLPDAWDKKNDCPITDKKVLQKLEKTHPGITSRMDTVTTTIRNYNIGLSKALARLDMLGEEYDQNQLKEQIRIELGIDTQSKKKVSLNGFIDSYIKDIESGRRMTPKGKPFTTGTIKNYKGFKVQFEDFQKEIHRTIDFQDVTIELRDRLVSFFMKKNYSQNTIWRHIKHLKSIMNVAFEEGLHSNTEFQKRKFTISQVETKEIYLTESELDAIYNLDLSELPHLDLARDVFLVGCYTAQRYSDYSRISEEHISTTPNGKKIISLTQLKTGAQVVIPVSPRLEAILSKYDYNLPTTYEQKVNKYIKTVVEMAKISKLEADDCYVKGKASTELKPKYEMVKTHTARRSGATNMYLAGIPVIAIMKITGHKTEREFLKYIRVTVQENAEHLADHPYFS